MPIDTIKIASSTDLAAIITLVNTSYRPENPALSWANESNIVRGNRINPAQAKALIENPNQTLLLGFEKHKLVACVLIEKIEQTAKIGLLTVAIEKQQQGLGKYMLQIAEQFIMESLGLHSIKMHVLLCRKELIEFYCRRGYLRTGEIHPYPAHLGVGNPLISDLQFEVLTKTLAHLDGCNVLKQKN